ncbi:lysylphosphatidylglycerol synthase transmembrane domain-containing protein [Halobacteriovorax sp. HLS]|uniref:lysylphosphatidylglycerol synthase transmembrane domain-containing protein n=1 Tax=Halobacteriovorax sp. HLS TaxID=2234000 RepID=UPI000FD76158|nr:lysylphosphatidylglycerol synthase transmembrane domain-containing protein [Halobacteriovorax sp. HLS]
MLKTLAKFLIAAILIGWLINSGKLDLTLVKRLISDSNNWIYASLLFIFQVSLSSVRWRLILKTKSKEYLPYRKLIGLTWIGQFFNTFLPGAVTGDLIKLVYAKDLDPKLPKTFLVMSVFIDRILGLVGLIFLTGIFTLVNYQEMIALSPKMKTLLPFNAILFLGSLVFLVSLFLPKKPRELILFLCEKVPVIGAKLKKTFEQVWLIGKNKKSIILAILISLVLQYGNIWVFWLVTEPFLEVSVPIGQLFTFIPIGLISIAVPISPAGLGVGHLIFDELFKLVNIKGGASLFNLYFIIIVCSNLIGIFPYLFSKKHDLSETSEFEGLEDSKD